MLRLITLGRALTDLLSPSLLADCGDGRQNLVAQRQSLRDAVRTVFYVCNIPSKSTAAGTVDGNSASNQ